MVTTLKKNLILILVFLLGSAAFSYFYLNYLQKQTIIPSSEGETKDLCVEFPAVSGEVSCQEAIQLALEKYPGIITSIRRTQAEYIDTQGIWLLKLILKEPVRANGVEYDIEVSVNRDNKEIFIYRFIERQK